MSGEFGGRELWLEVGGWGLGVRGGLQKYRKRAVQPSGFEK